MNQPVYLLIISLAQQMSVFLVGAYLLSKTPLFTPIVCLSDRPMHRLFVYFMFSGVCILGTYFGHPVHDAIANTRAIGAVLGGLFGGPLVGFGVGLTAGLHRYSLGGFSALACAISTTCEGLLAGGVHCWFRRYRHSNEELFSPLLVLLVTFVAEAMQMGLLLIFAKPYSDAKTLVEIIALPMLIANPIGACLFMMMVSDRKTLFDKFSSNYSQRALKLARRIMAVLPDLTVSSAQKMAQILREETGVAAVAITDREQVLAFEGVGADHHLPNTPITSDLTRKAIAEDSVVFADGVQHVYRCSCDPNCPLYSALVIPLRCAGEVIGTVKLYETRHRLFLTINRTIGEGIARIIEEQLVLSRYQQQQTLLSEARFKLVRAQIHPHFLFNALNTIAAVIRREPTQARTLVNELALFLRTSLKQQQELIPLSEELRYVRSYLNIEQVRFGDRLSIHIEIPESLQSLQIPSFTLQPLVENAIKHGINQSLQPGCLTLSAQCKPEQLKLYVEDSAGLFPATPPEEEGLGLSIVRTRLRNHYGEQAKLTIECIPEQLTRVCLSIPHHE